MRISSELGPAYLRSLRRSQHFTAKELRDLQAPLIERLCRHAAEQSEFYRQRLGPLFDRADHASGAFRFDRWREVPIFGKREAQAAGAALFARHVPAAVGATRAGRTSGSTGRPLEYRISQFSDIATAAALSRCLENHGCLMGGTLGYIASDIDNNSKPPLGFSSWTWNYAFAGAPWHRIAASSTIAEIEEWLRLRRLDVLVSYPSIVSALVKRLRARASPPIAVAAVVSTGETPAGSFAEDVKQAFGANHIDMYGAQEVGSFAFQCHVGTGLHVAAETTLVEIIRPDGAPAMPGESGRVVATAFYSYAMPMIRYDIGDIAVAGGPCPCGSHLPSLASVLGRTRDVFRFRDGVERWPRGINVLTNFIDFDQVQIVQRSLDTIEVRYVPSRAGGRCDRAGAACYLRQILSPLIDVDFVAVETIPRSASGKFQDFKSLVDTDDLP